MINVLGFIVIILLLVGCTRKDSGNIPVEQMNIIYNNTMCEMVQGTTMESVLSSTNPLFISADSGFYSENFDLFIASYQDMDIYYTLDGSTPNKSSIKYTGPIHICDATNKPNVYSMRTDVAGGYIGVPEDYVSDLYYKYAIPDYYVDKCNIVRISVFDGEKEIASTCRVYFVGTELKDKYENIGVAVIVADADSLFDYERGIYVIGKCGEELNSRLSPQLDADYLKYNWYNIRGNFNMTGREWERPAYITYFDESRNLVLDSGCGIRIQGNTSQRYAQKSLNVYARKEYGGKRTFDANLFDNDYKAHKFTIFAGGNDNLLKIKDSFIANATNTLQYSTMTYIPTVLFLNGEYWGMYYLTEKYDKDFIAYKYSLDKDDVVMIKDFQVEEGKEEDILLYDEMRDYIINHDMSNEECYSRACELIDIDSFIDYFATEIYIERKVDWPVANQAMWRTRNIGEGTYEDGKFRYMLFDANSAGMEDATNDETIMVMACDVLLACFIANDEFASKYIGKLLTLGNTVLSAEAYREYEANYINEYGEFLIDNHKRFYGNNLDEDVIYQLFNNLRTFYDSRLDEMIRSTKDLYSLNEATEAVLDIEYEADFGTVDIDRCPIKLVENRWRGRYLTGVCLTINAHAYEGHKVVGIKIDDKLIETDSYEFYIDNDTELEIIFE